MEQARLPGAFAFVTWYDGHAVPRGAARGIYPANALRFICLQAVTWKPTVAQELLSSPVAAAWPEIHGGDLLIAKILGGRSYGVHIPNLVQHLGADSVCSPGDTLAGAPRTTTRVGSSTPPRSSECEGGDFLMKAGSSLEPSWKGSGVRHAASRGLRGPWWVRVPQATAPVRPVRAREVGAATWGPAPTSLATAATAWRLARRPTHRSRRATASSPSSRLPVALSTRAPARQHLGRYIWWPVFR
jgi:hypothetical protein